MQSVQGKRNPAFEVLRVAAMLMVLAMHGLYYGGALSLKPLSPPMVSYPLAWLAEAFSFVCVNLYVLIGSYFMAESRFRLSRVMKLWVLTLFFSLAVGGVICVATGEPFHWQWALPVTTGQYWFVTDYLMLCVLSPFLNRLVRALGQRRLFGLLCVLAALFVALPTVGYPFVSADVKLNDGYHIGWFVVLYCFGAYLRLYPPRPRKPARLLWGYAWLSALTTLLWLGVQPLLGLLLGPDVPAWRPYAYNSVTVFGASLCLFLLFMNLRLNPTAKPVRGLVMLAPFTFSVYLIHMQPAFTARLWVDVLRLNSLTASPWLVPVTLLACAGVFLLLCGVDFVRAKLFALLGVDAFVTQTADRLEAKLRAMGARLNLRLTGTLTIPTTPAPPMATDAPDSKSNPEG